ncbi:MAG: radical SAM protein [Sulfolobaceae archaeon]|nr:radical SAM protein [Sulfolobaceae archaeon]
MKVVLTFPPDIHNLEIYKVTGITAPPLGLAYIAAVLEKEGHKVSIIDTPTLKLTMNEWLNEIRSLKPDIVGISMQTPMASKGYAAIKRIKEEMPDVIIVTGGTHPTYMYEESLKSGADIVVRFEGEYTMRELVSVIERKGLDKKTLKTVKGIAFKDNDHIIVTPNRPLIQNLDELPFPARHLLPMSKYTLFGKNINTAHLMASRGCPYGCTYCITSYYWGRRIRFRSAKNVADEVQELVEKYKAKYIIFTDDELTAGKRFLYEFVNEIKQRGLDIRFTCGSRVDIITKDLMKFLYDNGCTAIYFGVESSSQETIDKIGKKITIEQAKRVFEWKKELKGFATASFILGFPWETIDDMKNTVEFSIKLDPDYAQYTVLTPYPGTPIYDYALKHNLITDWNWEHYTTLRPVMRGFHFTSEQAGKMLGYAYAKFYLRFKFLWRELKAHRLGDLLHILITQALPKIKDMLTS